MACNGITTCKTVTAVIDCSKLYYAGDTMDFTLDFYDETGERLDLSEYESFKITLYTDGFKYITINYPQIDDLNYITLDDDVMGRIKIHIDPEISSRFLSGNIYALINLTKLPENTGGDYVYKTIGCLKLGTIKTTYID